MLALLLFEMSWIDFSERSSVSRRLLRAAMLPEEDDLVPELEVGESPLLGWKEGLFSKEA